ncbi:MAG TPA: nuclear transport factor 2 family protein [Tepidisphaeraceae bacterium]|jgi:ketosteroid isomerase-like protein|nr:nuclear transport factor 2 family protein [Tepidisphaeraceae bacterium]
MRRFAFSFLAVLVASSLFLPRGARAAESDDKTSAEVTKWLAKEANAYINSDDKALGEMLADDFVLVASVGQTFDKPTILAAVKEGKLKIEAIPAEDVKIRIYGTTAVVTGLSKLKGTFEGSDISETHRFTSVLIKHDGHWQCVNSQMTRVAE